MNVDMSTSIERSAIPKPPSGREHYKNKTFSLTDENLTARVPQPLFKMQRADLVLTTQSQP